MSIITGDCLDVMKGMEDNSISAIVTDPPYGLKFMGKQWDHGIPGVPFWKEAIRISKPGTFLLAFGGTRTYHRLACAIEDAGWEIRDCIQWIYGNGFPKSHNHFGIEGYGTALKPAYEPIMVAMKPCDGTFKNNAERWGQAGINIDESRVYTNEIINNHSRSSESSKTKGVYGDSKQQETYQTEGQKLGRWPANVILDEEAGKQLDEQSGTSFSRPDKRNGPDPKKGGINCYSKGWSNAPQYHNDSGGASRFFYCAKASASERGTENKHPTVKPLKLMKYLIKLVMPPEDGILLDPFCGSGSTIVAAQDLGHEAVGIEQNEEYAEMARNRLVYGENEELKNVICG